MDKSTWGGSRPGNPTGKRGGSRPGAGRFVRRIQLDSDRAQKLRILLQDRQSVTGNQDMNEDELVAGLIDAAYQARQPQENSKEE